MEMKAEGLQVAEMGGVVRTVSMGDFCTSVEFTSQSTTLSSMHHTANSHWLSILHTVVCMLPCCFLSVFHSLVPRQDCSLCPLPCEYVHQYYLSGFHLSMLIDYI